MSRLESAKRIMRSWFGTISFFVLLGLILGGIISVIAIPKPTIGIINIYGPLIDQEYTDEILDTLNYIKENDNIKAVVLQIDSPGGGVSVTEQIYLNLLRLRQQKPVVVSVGTIAASGAYYIAVASNFVYAEPTSQIGSIGAWVSLPRPEKLDENIGTTGPFKAIGGSRRKIVGRLEMVRQEFVEAVMSQRSNRLKMSEEELSRGEIYLGVESLKHGLIDEIGTKTDAIAKAASLAGVRNYKVVELEVKRPTFLFIFGMEDLKARTGLAPVYYYLYFESE